jgi:hypothetical protein
MAPPKVSIPGGARFLSMSQEEVTGCEGFKSRPISRKTTDMKTRFILLTFALGLGLFGDVLSATEYTYALASRGCMQSDERALEVYLTQEPYSGEAAAPMPYIRIEIEWSNWENVVGKGFKLVQLSQRGPDTQTPIVRAELNLERQERIWLRGTLRLKKVEVNKQVEGSYEFTGPNNLKWAGMFKAHWGKDRLPCG